MFLPRNRNGKKIYKNYTDYGEDSELYKSLKIDFHLNNTTK